MPELAEVEWYRKQWNPGIGDKVLAVELHGEKRVFRGSDTAAMARALTGSKLTASSARGKRMLFRFSSDAWLGVHLGMTGSLRCEAPEFQADKHDHLVLRQRARSLVFRDARQFGRVRFAQGKESPAWWDLETPEISEPAFNGEFVDEFLKRHGQAPIKAVLLMQNGFSGIGNWMADEILWRAKIRPSRCAGRLTRAGRHALLKETKFVATYSLRTLGIDYTDPPKTWLIHERWNEQGVCPIHHIKLRRATIGGRTAAWCAKCQK